MAIVPKASCETRLMRLKFLIFVRFVRLSRTLGFP